MRNIAAIVTGLSALALSGCVTAVPTKLAFGPQSPTALLVMAGPPAGNAFYTEFRKVDIDAGAFGPKVEIANAGLGGSQINGDTHSGVWLSVQEVPAGDYAIQNMSLVTGTYGGPVECLNGGSPVFALPAGRITVIRVDDVFAGRLTRRLPGIDDDAILKEFAAARTHFPNIVGEASIVHPRGMIQWDDHPYPCDSPTNIRRK